MGHLISVFRAQLLVDAFQDVKRLIVYGLMDIYSRLPRLYGSTKVSEAFLMILSKVYGENFSLTIWKLVQIWGRIDTLDFSFRLLISTQIIDFVISGFRPGEQKSSKRFWWFLRKSMVKMGPYRSRDSCIIYKLKKLIKSKKKWINKKKSKN